MIGDSDQYPDAERKLGREESSRPSDIYGVYFLLSLHLILTKLKKSIFLLVKVTHRAIINTVSS